MEPEKRENEISSLERRAFSNPIRFYLFSPVGFLLSLGYYVRPSIRLEIIV